MKKEKEKFVWLQQENENDNKYNLFQSFLEFNGTVNKFANNNKDTFTVATVLKYATNFNWKKRKSAYIKHNQQLQQKVMDKVNENVFKKAFETLDRTLPLLLQRYENILENEIEKALPPEKTLDFLMKFPDAMLKLHLLKEKLTTETEMQNPVIIQFVGGFGEIEIKDGDKNYICTGQNNCDCELCKNGGYIENCN